jgi:hypothetical protein
MGRIIICDKDKLKNCFSSIKLILEKFQVVTFVDSAPVLDKSLGR